MACTLDMPMSWPVEVALVALVVAAMFCGYQIGWVVGFMRRRRAGGTEG